MGYTVAILVGGETTGTRFRPLSINEPKTLFPISGKPLISYIVDSLVEQLAADVIDKVFFLGFYRDPSKFLKYTDDIGQAHPGIKFEYLSETNSKGTAGGLYHFRDLIFDDSSKGLLFVHGDIICQYPFKQLIKFHEEKGANTTIFGTNPLLISSHLRQVLNVKTEGEPPQAINIINNYGTIIAENSSRRVAHYVEKPSTEFSIQFGTNFDVLINGGIYLFDKSILSMLKKAIMRKSALSLDLDAKEDKSDNISLELDVLRHLPQTDGKFLVYESNDFWYQLKTPLSALIANSYFLKFETDLAMGSQYIPPVKICKDYVGSVIGPNVSIGKNVTIGKGTRLRNCIISDDVTIGANSLVANAIISHGARIGSWCRIEGSITDATLNREITHSHADGNIRSINNIVVLCENTAVKTDTFVFNSIVLPHKELKSDTKYEIVM